METTTVAQPGRLRRWSAPALAALTQLALLALMWSGYLLVRILAEGSRSTSMRHADDVWAFERTLRLPSEARLQEWALHSDTLIRIVNAIYAYVHFPAMGLTLILLYVRRREAFFWFRNMLIVMTSLALVIHVLYPLAPPRMRPDLGMIDTGKAFGMSTYGSEPGTGITNQYAAMPSMHVGWAFLITLVVILCLPSRWRWLALLHAVGMTLVVVVTGNHYWLDGIVGVALLAFAVLVVRTPRPRPRAPSVEDVGQVVGGDLLELGETT